MIDVFVSYKREERDIARKIVEKLNQRGYQVWWDTDLLTGSQFILETNNILKQAKVVIVLWSQRSVDSNWVIAESSIALQQQKLLPIAIDNTDIPAPFNTIQTYSVDPKDSAQVDQLINTISKVIEQKKLRSDAIAQDTEQDIDAIRLEIDAWKSIAKRSQNTLKGYQAYIERYGENALFYDLAQIRIAILKDTELKPTEIQAKKKNNLWLALGLICSYIVVAYWLASQSHTVGIPLPVRVRPGSNLVSIFALPLIFLFFIPFLHLSLLILREYPQAAVEKLAFTQRLILNLKNKFDLRLFYIAAMIFSLLPIAGIVHLEGKMLSGRAAVSEEKIHKLETRDSTFTFDRSMCVRQDSDYGCVIAEKWREHLLRINAVPFLFSGKAGNVFQYDPDDCKTTTLNCNGSTFFPFIQPWGYLLLALYIFKLWLSLIVTAAKVYFQRSTHNV